MCFATSVGEFERPRVYDHKPGDRYFVLIGGGTSMYQVRGDKWRFVDPRGSLHWLDAVDDLGDRSDWREYTQVDMGFVRLFAATWGIRFSGLGVNCNQWRASLADRVARALAAGERMALNRLLTQHVICRHCRANVRLDGLDYCEAEACKTASRRAADEYHREEAVVEAEARAADERAERFDYDLNGAD